MTTSDGVHPPPGAELTNGSIPFPTKADAYPSPSSSSRFSDSGGRRRRRRGSPASSHTVSSPTALTSVVVAAAADVGTSSIDRVRSSRRNQLRGRDRRTCGRCAGRIWRRRRRRLTDSPDRCPLSVAALRAVTFACALMTAALLLRNASGNGGSVEEMGGLVVRREEGGVNDSKLLRGRGGADGTAVGARPSTMAQRTLLQIFSPIFLTWSVPYLRSSSTVSRAASSVDPSPPWDLPYVHIVNTRFMQSQGTLKTLALARLELFRAFCLPTMVHQSTQNFLWIIKTDPNLDVDVRTKMVEMLAPYPNFYLVGSEHNYLIGHKEGAWRGGVEGEDVLSSPIYAGDVERLRSAHTARDERIVLQTRLDADDGLVTGYLEWVQLSAMEAFLPGVGGTKKRSGEGADAPGEAPGSGDFNPNYVMGTLPEDTSDSENDGGGGGGREKAPVRPRWMYWCSRQVVEWFANPRYDRGELNAIQHSHLCITPGITVGFPVGTPHLSVPQHEHAKLYREIERDGGCGLKDNTSCLTWVQSFPMMAIRSRTATSAGMMGIELDPKDALPWDKRELLWKLIQTRHFYVKEEDARRANSFLRENVVEIARDNLRGQCTEGHSCKMSSKERLQRLIELKEHGAFGVDFGVGKTAKV